MRGPGGPVTALAFHPRNGTLAAATERGALRAWTVRSGAELATRSAHRGATYGLAFTPEGSRLVSASYDRTVRLWDVADWELAGTLRGAAADGLYGVAIPAKDACILVGGLDGRVHVFPAAP